MSIASLGHSTLWKYKPEVKREISRTPDDKESWSPVVEEIDEIQQQKAREEQRKRIELPAIVDFKTNPKSRQYSSRFTAVNRDIGTLQMVEATYDEIAGALEPAIEAGKPLSEESGGISALRTELQGIIRNREASVQQVVTSEVQGISDFVDSQGMASSIDQLDSYYAQVKQARKVVRDELNGVAEAFGTLFGREREERNNVHGVIDDPDSATMTAEDLRQRLLKVGSAALIVQANQNPELAFGLLR